MLGLGFGLAGVAARGGVGPIAAVLWDFTNPASPLPGFSLTRATTGTHVAQDGSIQSAAINQPRFDWTGGVRALLVEPSATNLLRHSDDLLNGAWAKDPGAAWSYQSGVISGRSIWMLTAVASSSGWTGQTINTTAASVISARVKRGTARYVYMQASDSTNAGYKASWFDLDVGVAASTNIVAGGSPVGITLGPVVAVNEGAGVWRLSVAVSGNSRFMGFGFSNANGSRAQTDGQTGYLFDPQIEIGSTATSCIPTAEAAVTRAADTLASLAMSAIWAAAGSCRARLSSTWRLGLRTARRAGICGRLTTLETMLWRHGHTSQDRRMIGRCCLPVTALPTPIC